MGYSRYLLCRRGRVCGDRWGAGALREGHAHDGVRHPHERRVEGRRAQRRGAARAAVRSALRGTLRQQPVPGTRQVHLAGRLSLRGTVHREPVRTSRINTAK